jgi:hypothetical protein
MSEPKDELLPQKDEPSDERHLWDPTAPPDPFVSRLEAELRGVHTPAPLGALPPRVASGGAGRVLRFATVGAALAAAASVAWLFLRTPDATPLADLAGTATSPPSAITAVAPSPSALVSSGPSFAWRALTGEPAIDGTPAGAEGKLAAGRWLETGPDARVRLDVADIGHVEVGAGSRLKLVGSGPGEHRLALERGRISAQVDAPPRLFLIETKGATAIDLGCAYDLEIDAQGRGKLGVTSGAVELAGGRARALPVVVPRGAECAIDPATGPGTPVWSRLSPDAKARVGRFDAAPTDIAALGEVLAVLGDRDSLTLVHLLDGAPAERRAEIVTRLSAIEPLPTGVTKQALIEGSRDALTRYRAAIEPRWFPGPKGKGAWNDKAAGPR